MIIDDRIVKDYLNGNHIESYKDCWIFNCFEKHTVFEMPDSMHTEWVSKLYDKLKEQILNFKPRNSEAVKMLFPDFDKIASGYTIMLVVGFPDPYDAMVLEHNGKEYMVFDLIQFGKDSLNEDYSCHRVLTHELIHMCLHKYYPVPNNPSYIDYLNYTAFDEGFAHALSYPEDISSFIFDDFLERKFLGAKETLKSTIKEVDQTKQAEYSQSADTGDYWDKFASVSGKLFILKNLNTIQEIYHNGWSDFASRIII